LINSPTLLQSYFAAKEFGFADCGENPANVSQFVAGIRHGDLSRCADRSNRREASANAQWQLAHDDRDP
jgi:hypothetical protein